MCINMLLIIVFVLISVKEGSGKENIAVGQNHWMGNCIALCSGFKEYFIYKRAENASNSVYGPFQIWEYQRSGQAVNCDCQKYRYKAAEIHGKHLNENVFLDKEFDLYVAVESLMEPVRLFNRIDINQDNLIDYQEAVSFYSKGDSNFNSKHFGQYFTWISGGDLLQTFSESVVFSAIQCAQLVMSYSIMNKETVAVSIENSLKIAYEVLDRFKLLNEESLINFSETVLEIVNDPNTNGEIEPRKRLDQVNKKLESNLLSLIKVK